MAAVVEVSERTGQNMAAAARYEALLATLLQLERVLLADGPAGVVDGARDPQLAIELLDLAEANVRAAAGVTRVLGRDPAGFHERLLEVERLRDAAWFMLDLAEAQR